MSLVLAGNTSGQTTLQATDAVTATITLPSATGTVQLANSALNGSLGATTPSTVVATTITASGAVSLATTATANSVVTIGGAPSTNNSGAIKLITSSNQYNWEISQGLHTADGVFDITPSTLVGGSTFTTPVLSLRTTGGVQTLNTISVGNATPSASGAGITFPATQSASTDANTLDDYEEGTWTPNQGTGLTVVGAFSSSGTYVKIGSLVMVKGKLVGATTIALAASGQITTNLPFLSNNVASVNMGGAFNNATVASIVYVGSNTFYVYNTATALPATGEMFFSATYQSV